MIHDLTAGHLDATGAVLRPLDMRIVGRLLDELGRTDDEGTPTLDGWKVRVENGCVILPWKGGRTNRLAEEFALRLQRETGCQISDREHGRMIQPEQLAGLARTEAAAG
jgi:hypothetical protein